MKTEKLIYKESELPQKSEKWKKFRYGKLGTSEIPIIRGKFPTIWCDDYELFLRKMGKPFDFSNKYMDTGNEFEDKARKFVELYLKDGTNSENVYDRTNGFDVIEPNFKQYTIQYKDFPQIFASFDGLDIRNKLVLELKCPGEKVFTKLLKNRKPTVPKMYIDQTQGQLMISDSHFNINRGIFGVYYDDGVLLRDKKTKTEKLIKLILIETNLDKEYCEEMLTICKKYCNIIDNRRWEKNWKD